MNKLQTYGAIRKDRLDKAHWLASFLHEAAQQKLLSNEQQQSIQAQMMQLMVFLATRYTAGASSSIREETAQSLMACAAYSIGHTLKKLPTDLALADLCETPLKALFERGQSELRNLLAESKALYAVLLKNSMPLGSVTWQSTMHTGLAEFFAAYHVYDAAHESPGLLDYPTALPLEGAGGIEYISRFLKRLAMEDSLIRLWPLNEVDGLIRAGGAVEAPVNVFTLVLNNAMGAVLCGRRAETLSLSQEDRIFLREKLAGIPLRRALRTATDTLCQHLNMKGTALNRYMSDTAASLAPAIKNALQNHTLPRVFLTLKAAPKIVFFHDAPRMDDKLFRILVNEIAECDKPADRAELISMNVASIADLADLFEAHCLTSGDIHAVLKTLGDDALSMLLCLCRQSAPDSLHTSDAEHTWHSALYAHIHSLGTEKQQHIRDMAKHIEFV
jgi:hypothetical protein